MPRLGVFQQEIGRINAQLEGGRSDGAGGGAKANQASAIRLAKNGSRRQKGREEIGIEA